MRTKVQIDREAADREPVLVTWWLKSEEVRDRTVELRQHQSATRMSPETALLGHVENVEGGSASFAVVFESDAAFAADVIDCAEPVALVAVVIAAAVVSLAVSGYFPGSSSCL